MSTVVAIDGPAGAGKSTVARALAARMGYVYVNTGMLYRAIAYAAGAAGIDLESVPADFLNRLQLEPENDGVRLNGRRLEEELRTPECSQGASVVSKQPEVRAALLPIQRRAAERGWIVMEGRDIGTVVFPDAAAKFFITATVEERARRRLAQLGNRAGQLTLDAVKAEIEERDLRDSTRRIAPLKPAPGAIVVDTTGLTIEQVVERLAGELARA